ncbi:MAG: MBL fold metallo-hydrolase [bacterium]
MISIFLMINLILVNNLKVHFIDIGQGDACLIETGQSYYLVDAGVDRSDDKLLNYLNSVGVDTIDAGLMTHPDYDHYGEFQDLIESGVVLLRFVRNKDHKDNITFLNLLATLANYQIPVDTVDYTDSLNWGLETQILSPNYNNGFGGYNNNSIVFTVNYGQIKFLFTGDSETENNNYLINNYNMDIDVLKVSHHGSTNGTDLNFISSTTPLISVVSSGINNYGHPSHDVISLLRIGGSLVYSTADDCSTWVGNGSSDYSVDDDVVVETDGVRIWVNGVLVYDPTVVEEVYSPDQDFSCSNFVINQRFEFRLDLSESCNFSLEIFNISGQKIDEFAINDLGIGEYNFNMNLENAAAGMYLLKVNFNRTTISKSLILLE